MKGRGIVKVFVLIIICSCMIAMSSRAAFGAGASVIYDSNDKSFIIAPDSTDLFQAFKGAMPGDSLTQAIELANRGDKTIRLYLKAEIPEQGDTELLNQLALEVLSADGKSISKDKASYAGNLKDRVLLGTLKPGEKSQLTAALKVPMETGNEYQSRLGKINWIFSAEELEDDRVYPPTGDNGRYIIYIAASAAALAGILVIIAVKKRKTC